MFKDVKKFITIIRGQKYRQLMQLEPRYHDGLNHLAESLHPKRQILKVTDITAINHDTYIIKFISGNSKKELAPFRAGQYIGLKVDIDGVHTGRAFSLVSSPNNLAYYEIAVKNVGDIGFVSPYLCNDLEVGNYLEATEPLGSLYYNPIFHGKRLVFIAGGIGITPFMSMVRNIYERRLEIEVHFLFGCLTEKDLVFHEELSEMASKYEFIHYYPILSDPSDSWTGERGFISKDIIRKLTGILDGTMYYVVGPDPMLDYLRDQFNSLNIPVHRITWEVNPPISDITKTIGWPQKISKENTVKCKINWMIHGIRKTETISVKSNEPLLNSLERAKIPGLVLKHACRGGECAFCRTNLIQGEYFIPQNIVIRKGDRENGFIHPCVSYPISNIEIEVFTN
ncbi:MAG: FAD-binding oxidoreductase [Promethearchaeota archaeon]